MSRRSSGEGTIVQRKDGLYQASLQVEGKRRTVYAKTRQEVVIKLDELKRQAIRLGALPDAGLRNVNDLMDSFLETIAPRVRPSTLSTYKQQCNKHIRPALGKLPLAKVTPYRLQSLYAAIRESGRKRTSEAVHSLLRQAFDLAELWQWVAENPCKRVVRPTHQAERKEMWTHEQLRTFLDGTRDHWLHPLWVTLVCTGCRLGELLALTWSDVDLAEGRISIAKTVQRVDGEWIVTCPKTQAGLRTVTLPQEGVDALQHQAQLRLANGGGSLVFSRTTDPIHRATVSHAMQRECDRLGVPRLTPHGLRHMHASLLLDQGLPIPLVSQRLGHSNPAMTMSVYAHVIIKRDDEATRAIERAMAM